MFSFPQIREELYKVHTFTKSSDYVITRYRKASIYNELSYDLFSFAKKFNNNSIRKDDMAYFESMNRMKYHSIRMVHVFEYNCLLHVLEDPLFDAQGMTIDYEKKRLYFDSFEIVIKSILEIYKHLVKKIPDTIYGVRQIIQDLQFISTNYTAILALIES
jgi:hypothetical protein